MGDEPRRSGRATKGQNPKILDQSPPSSSAAKKSKKQQQTTKRESNRVNSPSPEEEDDGDAIIRCICGTIVEDSDDERMMICCDVCSCWQHNECMEVPEDEKDLPEKYLCETCDPEAHKALLEKVARGEKPWEERVKERQQKKNQKKKAGKKGKGGAKAKAGEAKPKGGEVANDNSSTVVEAEETEPVKKVIAETVLVSDTKGKASVTPSKTPTKSPAKSGETKTKSGETKNTTADTKSKGTAQKKSPPPGKPNGGNKRKDREESADGRATDTGNEPKARKLSVGQSRAERSSTSSKPKEEKRSTSSKPKGEKRSTSSKPKGEKQSTSSKPKEEKRSALAQRKANQINQTELVTNVQELLHDVRRLSAGAMVGTINKLIPIAQSEGKYKLPEWEGAMTVATRIGLAIEHAVFMHYSNRPGDPGTEYRSRLRSMIFNVKKNPLLRDGLLQGTLTPDQFSLMSSDDMMDQELRELNAELLKQVEKQHIAIKEEGPRIRHTHKGMEIVGADLDGTSDPVFSDRPVRPRRESAVEDGWELVNSPPSTATSPTVPFSGLSILEGQSASMTGEVGSPTINNESNANFTAPTTASNSTSAPASVPFSMQDVWSSIQGQTGERKQRPTLQTIQTTSPNTIDAEHPSAVGTDPEIDELLKDEEMESPPYSPTDQASDPDIVWRGRLSCYGVAEFFGTAKHVAGPDMSHVVSWSRLMPPHLRIDHRIPADRANKYLCELRFSRTTDVVVVAITPTGGARGQAGFEKMWEHFVTRQKYGVARGITNSLIRDIYVIPLQAGMMDLPTFLEMLEDTHIGKPRPERMIVVTYVIKSLYRPPPREAQQTPATPSNGTGLTTAANTNPADVGHDTSIVSAVGPVASPITPHPNQHNPYLHIQQSLEAAVASSIVSSNNNNTAEAILGPFINASVVKQLLSQTPDIGPVQLTVIKDILEKVPEAGEDFELLTRLLMEKSQAEGR
ncbi:MAG: hypothetical protein M1816_007482 [Peltula sp. TS41687]|nr:MAG: hypothetical protein M1816_007482 [Peltula sp. TS41687]